MTNLLLLSVVVLDLVLVAAFFWINRRQKRQEAMMSDFESERRLLSELRQSFSREVETAEKRTKEVLGRIEVLALEVEQDARNSAKFVGEEVDSIMSQIGSRFEEPLQILAEKQQYIESLMARIQSEKASIAAVTERAGAMTKILKSDSKPDDLLREFEDRKFSEIRALLAKGCSVRKISEDLHVSENEVRTVANLR
jgi:DNA-binding NarL/FixJ family response regulator